MSRKAVGLDLQAGFHTGSPETPATPVDPALLVKLKLFRTTGDTADYVSARISTRPTP